VLGSTEKASNGGIESIRPPSISMDDSHKSGGFLSGGVSNQFLTNKAGEASASKIGMQEISFIKRD
jgi:hypothetical protein